MDELGIYIHIPFCVRKCAYCDFLSFPVREPDRKRYLKALGRELSIYGDVLAAGTVKQRVRTIYLGGGTPSLLTAKELTGIFDILKEGFDLSDCLEVTLEANPGTLTKEFLEAAVKAGVNRLSLGAQSFADDELKLLGRIHNRQEIMDAYEMARWAGIENISMDLISALPGQTMKAWEKNLRTLAELGPEHISCYSLILEEGTPMYEEYCGAHKPVLPLPDEDTERQMYHRTAEILREYGYERYEISNYARPGKESLHNSSYWNGIPYIGAGLGASSYLPAEVVRMLPEAENSFAAQETQSQETQSQETQSQETQSQETVLLSQLPAVEMSPEVQMVRLKNTSSLTAYCSGMEKDTFIIEEKEELKQEDLISEYMILGLRRTAGISKKDFFKQFGLEAEEYFSDVIRRHVADGLLKANGECIRLTEKGLDLANLVMADFL